MAATRRLAASLVGFAALAAMALPARAQDAPKPPPAPAAGEKVYTGKEAKVRKYLRLLRFKENVMEQMGVAFEAQAETGMLPKGFVKKFQETADFGALEDIFAGIWGDLMDEPTLDSVNAFLETPAGQKYVEASTKILRPMMEKIQPWAMESAMKTMQALSGGEHEEDEGGEMEEEEGEEGDEGTIGALGRAERTSNESAAVRTLRNLASCQAQLQTSEKIDVDHDGIGEYGTLLEMTGSVGVRAGFQGGAGESGIAASDFSQKGSLVTPPFLSPKLADVNGDGVVVKSGYCFRIFLPDTTVKNAGFAHETGPKEKVGLAGGTGKVGVDLSETTWCAYAWPEKLGESGTRVFFVNQSGDVLQTSNETNKWSGKKVPTPNAAFRGMGITSPIAIGTTGRDGDIWKVTN